MKYLLLFSLIFLFIVAAVPVSAAIKIVDVNLVPSANCLSQHPCTTLEPSNTVPSISLGPSAAVPSGTAVSGQPSSSPSVVPSVNPSPSSTPCSTSQSSVFSQSTGTVQAFHYHGKRHHPMKRGFLQQFFELLLQLLQFLLQKIGIQLPAINPCSPSSSPSGTPSESPSGAPSVSGEQPTPSSTISQSPPASGSGTTTNSGFVTAPGEKLMLNGKQFQFIGFNAGMAGVCWSSDWTTAQMDTYFSNLPSNGMTRIFAVQPVGASFINTIVTEAAKYKQHLILVLSDDDSNCDDTDGAPSGAGSGKTATYYESGWKGQYLTWINTIVPMFKDSTTVAMWEIANEPFHAGATGSELGLSTMQSYLNGAAAAIRADDPNHLITVGSTDAADYGSTSNYTQAQSGSDINVLDFHDYAWDYENGATISSMFATEQSAASQLNKPYMIDEAGVEGGSGCSSSSGFSLADRVTYLINKANDYLGAGASGIAFWDYEQVAESNCSYEIVPPSDPMISAVKNYALPN